MRTDAAIALFVFLLNLSALSAAESGWPAWRGPNANGFSADAVPPVEWDENTNIRWKTAVPGRGMSSPIVWKITRDTSYVPSPLLAYGGLYYLKGNEATLSCVDPASGKALFGPKALEGCAGAYASPVAADGRVYVTARNGVTAVLKAAPGHEVLATNRLDDSFTASAALAGSELFLRGLKSLYCISAGPKP